VVGEEEFLVERSVHDMLTEVRQVEPQAELRRHEVSDLTPAELIELLSPSLFGEGQLVVLASAQDAGKEIADAILS
jgi:DNA polymerase-3 subunit delta